MGRIYVGDGNSFVWQWQPKEQIVLEGYPEGVYVHYANCDTVEAPVVQSRMEGGKLVADIPPELMQSDKDITVYVCDADGTKHCHFLAVLSRPKPESYVTEPVEVLRYETLDERVKKLEEEGVGGGGGGSCDCEPAYVASGEPPEDVGVLWIDTSEPDEALALGMTVVETEEGVEIYAADELGPTRATVRHGRDGAPGTTPVKGVDYFTPGEVQEIAEQAAGMAQLPGGGGEEWEMLWEKTFSEDDLGTVSWLFTPNSPATEIVVVAQNLRSNQTLGWLLKVNDLPIMPHRSYLNTDGTKCQQLYCKLTGNIWQVQCAESSSKNLGFVNLLTVSGDLNVSGKAETVEFNQSAVQDYQVYGGSVRIYAR